MGQDRTGIYMVGWLIVAGMALFILSGVTYAATGIRTRKVNCNQLTPKTGAVYCTQAPAPAPAPDHGAH